VSLADSSQANGLYHKAHKKIAHVDPETWETIEPKSENGWKFELFLHSFLPMVDQGKLGVLVVNRESEFAPVKNADGPTTTTFGYSAEPLPDTPSYARRQLMQEMTRWLSKAEKDGLRIDPATKGKIEVNFLLSYAGENLAWLKNIHKKKPISGAGGYLDHEGEYLETTDE